MKANFTNLECRPTLRGESVRVNFNQQIGEMIYQNAKTLKEAKLANRIYDAEGEIEISEEEKETIKRGADNFVWWAKAAILTALGEEPKEAE